MNTDGFKTWSSGGVHAVGCQCLTCLSYLGQWNTTAAAPLYISTLASGGSYVIKSEPPKRNVVCARCAQGHGSKPCKSVVRGSRHG